MTRTRTETETKTKKMTVIEKVQKTLYFDREKKIVQEY
jgi:hypothetical protein